MGYATENGAFFDCFYLRDELTTAIPGISVPVTFEDLKPFANPIAGKEQRRS
jgi:hypothetical protein